MEKNFEIPKNLIIRIPKEFHEQMITAYHTGFERGMYQAIRQLEPQVNKTISEHNEVIKSLKTIYNDSKNNI